MATEIATPVREGYKQTEIGEIPESWEVKALSQVAGITMGQSPPSSDCNEDGAGIPFFQGCAEFGDPYPKAVKWIVEPLKQAEAGDVLISVRAPVGDLNLASERCCIGRGLAAIRSVDGVQSFLYCLMQAQKRDLNRLAQGSTFMAINSDHLADLLCPAPPLPEQQAIAEVLESVDDSIQATQGVIEQQRVVKQGLLQQLLTRGIGHTKFKQTEIGEIPESWEVKALGDVGELKNGINKAKEDFGFGSLFLNISDAYSPVLDICSLERLNATDKEIREYRLKHGDFVFVRSSVKPTGVGYPTLFKSAPEPVLFCGFMIRLRPSSEIQVHDFLLHVMRSDSFRSNLFRVSTISANTNVNQAALSKLLVPLPPLPEQQAIADILQSVDDSIRAEEERLTQLETLKRGLMQDLLTGKVRVKVA
jgi:type I restriction enzyme, S subunit